MHQRKGKGNKKSEQTAPKSFPKNTSKDKRKSAKKEKSSIILIFLHGLVIFYLFMCTTRMVRLIDYKILRWLSGLEDDHYYYQDLYIMPLAPHRYKMPDYASSIWFFHRTVTSMDDFVSFVEQEST